jgi:hypothetical protein
LDAIEAIEECVEPIVEPPVKLVPQTFWRLLMSSPGGCVHLMRFDEFGAKKRHDRHRNEIRGEQGKHHCESERRKEKYTYPGEEGDREEHNCSSQCRSQYRKGDFFAAVLSCHFRRLSQLHVAKDVLQDDNRVVDQPGKR